MFQKKTPLVVNKVQYLACPVIDPCDTANPEMKYNGDLLQGYVLVKNQRDQCAIKVAMMNDCQKKLVLSGDGSNMEK